MHIQLISLIQMQLIIIKLKKSQFLVAMAGGLIGYGWKIVHSLFVLFDFY